MRSVRVHLLASAAVALALALAGSEHVAAQSAVQIDASVSTPDATTLPPSTATPASDAAQPPTTAAPANIEPVKIEPAKAEPTEPTTNSTPTATAAADSPNDLLAAKLREMAGGKFDRIIGGKKDRAGIEAFYTERNFTPLWVSDGDWNARAKAVVAYLARVDADGLDPSDYATPQIKPSADPDALAEAELRFTQTVLTFARHAQVGRVHWSRVAADILYDQVKPEPADVLGKLVGAAKVADVLGSFQPQQAAYKALKAKLAEARGNKGEAGPPRIATGLVLRYAKDKKGNEVLMNDPRVPLLRQRLGVTGDPADTTYDKELSGAVAKFQKERGLPPTGQLTTATIEALNGPKRDRDADIIIANMERWRWVPRELGKDHVIVNIPEFTLRLIHNDALYWKTKIVVGKPNLPTPITSAEMKFITVNPTWNVPPSIIQNEYLPALANDPDAMTRIGLKVATNPDGTVRIWQPPGDRNALGRIRFNFPNKFLVYQHDTPDKHLFAHERRAYSHGCMRVENPVMYGEKLLSIVRPNDGYTQERLRKMFNSGEVNIDFPTFLPVHLTYQTAFVDEDGKLQIREDVYGRDARLLALLKGSERKVADLAIERARGGSGKPVRAPAGVFWAAGSGGPSFFERLFGGTQTTPPQRVRQRAARTTNDAVR